ncbi:MAG: hypothetical protein ACK41P_07210 [Asticcacaulis sp.]
MTRTTVTALLIAALSTAFAGCASTAPVALNRSEAISTCLAEAEASYQASPAYVGASHRHKRRLDHALTPARLEARKACRGSQSL